MLLIRTVLDRRLPYLLYSSRVDRVKFRVLETAACVMCHVSCVMCHDVSCMFGGVLVR
jgi:hypothetical protein